MSQISIEPNKQGHLQKAAFLKGKKAQTFH